MLWIMVEKYGSQIVGSHQSHQKRAPVLSMLTDATKISKR